MAGVHARKALVLQTMKLVSEHGNITTGFSKVVKQCKLVDGDIGRCVMSMKVAEEHTNPIGTLHGGCCATLVDIVSSYALCTEDLESVKRLGVSVELSLSLLKAAKLNDDILIEANLLKGGKTLAFLDVEIRNKETGELLVKGKHTKFVGNPLMPSSREGLTKE